MGNQHIKTGYGKKNTSGAKFRYIPKWNDSLQSYLHKSPGLKKKWFPLSYEMSNAMWELELKGAAPVLFDGMVAGNAAAVLEISNKKHLIVSKSGKKGCQRMDPFTDTCIVLDFDYNTWSCDYVSEKKEVFPTSDTPLHYSALVMNLDLGWSEYPVVALHGHALDTEKKARKFGFPISLEETFPSTPKDTESMRDLFVKFPYPKHKVFIRKGHGFFILGASFPEAIKTFRDSVVPAIANHK